MSQPRALLSLVLARRFLRSRALARTTLVMVVTAAFLFASFASLSSLTLSGRQAVERDLGRFGASVDLGAFEELLVAPGHREVVRQLARAGRTAGAHDRTLELVSLDVVPTGIDPPRTDYSEAPWRSLPFPGRFSLESGRWPARAGEVAVTNADILGLAANERLSVLSGRHEFRVVGTARDRYGRSPTILAAPGTWASLDPAVIHAFPTLSASARVLVPATNVSALVDAIAETLARRPGAAPEPKLRGLLHESTTTRDELFDDSERSWLDRLPAAYSIPFVVCPLLAVFLAFGLSDRRLRRNLSVLTDLGVGAGQAVGGLALALIAWILIAALAGAVLGIGVAVAARPILRAAHPLPLSPVHGLADPAVRLLAMVVAGGLVSAVALRASHPARRGESGRPSPRRKRWRDLRHILAVIVGCAAVVQVARLDSAANASVLAGTVALGVLLLVPETLALVVRGLPERAALPRLARRQLLADRRRAIIAGATLAAALGLPLGFLTLLDTTFRTLEADLAPEVFPGQLALAGLGGTFVPPSPAVARTVRDALAPSETAIPFRYLHSGKTSVYVEGTRGGFVIALDTPGQVAALMDRRLSMLETQTLRRGGMVVWGNSTRARSVTLVAEATDDRRPIVTVSVPAAPADAPVVEWGGGTRGVVLTETARRSRLPVAGGALFYTGLSSDDVSAARRAVLQAGLDPQQVWVFEPPRARVPPVALYAAATGLVLLTLLTCLAVAHGQAAVLRGYVGTLIAIGLSTSWARRVLLIEQAVIMGVATLLAVVIAIPPVLVAVWRLPEYVLGIPWSWLASVIALVYMGSFLAMFSASRRLRARPFPHS